MSVVKEKDGERDVPTAGARIPGSAKGALLGWWRAAASASRKAWYRLPATSSLLSLSVFSSSVLEEEMQRREGRWWRGRQSLRWLQVVGGSMPLTPLPRLWT